MLKKITLVSLLFFAFSTINAQEDTTKVWKFTGENKLTFGNVALSNWSAGGTNAMSGLLSIDYKYNYKKDKTSWDNRLILMYGLINQNNAGFEKTDDRIDFTSTYGYQIDGSKWNYSMLVNFKTQFAEGLVDSTYKAHSVDGDGDPIYIEKPGGSGNYEKLMEDKTDRVAGSKFMAPGYLTLAPGVEYKPSDNFKVNISPLAAKLTFMLDDRLSSEGAFGVDPGSKMRTELGFNVDGYWKQAFSDNFYMENNLRLYTNYLENFGNVDVDWVFKLNLTISKYFTAQFILNTLYDDDVQIERMEDGIVKTGPIIQFKSSLGVGLVYTFE
ncbi:MAG: DUF3078 domain-containing protein [Flavobacteriales bacterium]|nr:DUF3078 domain-containing protein [Flavobacteriales bacterium]